MSLTAPLPPSPTSNLLLILMSSRVSQSRNDSVLHILTAQAQWTKNTMFFN